MIDLKQIVDYIEQRVEVEIAPLKYRVKYRNMNFNPKRGETWIEVKVNIVDAEPISIGFRDRYHGYVLLTARTQFAKFQNDDLDLSTALIEMFNRHKNSSKIVFGVSVPQFMNEVQEQQTTNIKTEFYIDSCTNTY